MDSVRNIFLVGFMASGKTRVGRALAESLSNAAAARGDRGWTLVDADDVIVARAGKPIHRIFSEDGEPAFRELERQVIADLCAGERQVIASGGGSFVDPQNREVMLSGGQVFFLSASPAEILRRVQEEDAGGPIRPLLAVDDPEARIAELLAQRLPAYNQAHYTVDTDALTPEEVAARIGGICRVLPGV
jgi:shikimate kinase